MTAAPGLPDPHALFAALDATWPAARTLTQGPFTLREGAGGGKRVSAATLDASGASRAAGAEIAGAEAAMRALDQTPLFMIRPGDDALDAQLSARNYAQVDPTVLYAAPVSEIAAPPAPVTLFALWPPLQIIRDIWSERGIGAARQAVMDRAQEPKTTFISRVSDRAAGAAFAACHQDIAMLHAIEVLPGLRRKGAARNIVTGTAWWAHQQGMDWLALAVTRANTPARTLYAALGMVEICGYHYRIGQG